MVSSMPNNRSDFGVGVLNNLLYAVNNFNIILIMSSILYFYRINVGRRF